MNNRRRGISWELEAIHRLREIGFTKAVSSRQESRALDAQKVDVCFTDPYNFQCKLSTQKVDYPKVLAEMPKRGINVILHKYATRTKKNFNTEGRYVILNFDDFLNLITHGD